METKVKSIKLLKKCKKCEEKLLIKDNAIINKSQKCKCKLKKPKEKKSRLMKRSLSSGERLSKKWITTTKNFLRKYTKEKSR